MSHTFTFKSRSVSSMDGFIKGVEWVNDSDTEITDSGRTALGVFFVVIIDHSEREHMESEHDLDSADYDECR